MIAYTPVVLRDGSRVRLRPLAEDEGDRERLRRLFYRLSPESVYHRFMSPLPEPRADMADRLLDLDHDDREAVAALVDDEVVGVARYHRDGAAQDRADLAVLVEDAWQRRGLSMLLIGAIADVAREHGIGHFTASILSENNVAIRMVRRAFPGAVFHLDGTEMQAVMPLTDQPASGRG
ncbi:MAG: GNAT family N-acetyltransferase [Candidatus Dormibacteraceae bacterium]